MKISVVMTVYNGEKYLLEQMDSILDQSYLPNEIIISDDCSTDKSMDILESYKSNNDVDIKVFRNDYNLGFTKNFQNAISKCNGDIIFFSFRKKLFFYYIKFINFF